MFRNLRLVFALPLSFWTFVVMFFVCAFLWYHYSDIDYVSANFWSSVLAYFDLLLAWMVVVGFPLLLAIIVYKSFLFGRGSQKKSGFAWFFGGILGILITGASCCGVGLISVLGMSAVLPFLERFPYHGIEVRFFAVAVLFYAVFDALRDIDSCRIQKIH